MTFLSNFFISSIIFWMAWVIIPVIMEIIPAIMDFVILLKRRIYLNTSHAIYIDGKRGQVHPHTWELTLRLLYMQENFIAFHTLEKRIEQYMAKYQDICLNDVEPFDRINPTLENCCEHFKNELKDILIVNKGVTQIKFTYPYFKQGVLLSVVGMIGLIGVAMTISQKRPFTYRRKMV